MKFQVFFLTITVQRSKVSEAEILQEQQIKKMMDEVKERQVPYCSHL
ncbi:YrzI family protein [Bacillus pseudomycoides]|nr:YrzI family small protein [Bacillus pseudomycoides]PEI94304.1 YrzI family protein [Bacillus pseudomycoides]